MPEKETASDRDSLVQELESGHKRFRATIASLPEEAYEETWLGTWSLTEVLAHMAGWFRQMGSAFERVGRGERPAPEGVDLGDVEAWNSKFAAAKKATGKEALADWDAAYGQFLAAATALTADLYGIDPEKGRPRIGNRLISGAGIEHFAEHQPEVDEWLRSRG